jgi:hypothetical protein
VVDEIEAAGGEAVANFDNVATAEGGAIVQDGAGRLRHGGHSHQQRGHPARQEFFAKMPPENWQAVLDVHLTGPIT